MKYYLGKTIKLSFEQTESKLADVLQQEGFGILSNIDIQKLMKEKLGKEFKKYKILGVCNPNFSYKALEVDDKIGTLLPCNIAIQEQADKSVDIAIVNPLQSIGGTGNPELIDISMTLKNIMEKVLTKL